MATDTELMARAIALARRGWYSTPPNPRVGCVLVRDDKVIGEGWHHHPGGAHAEVNALRDAQARFGGAAGATAYVSLEPCGHQGRTPACTDALIAAGVARVVDAMEDPNPQVSGAGLAALRSAGIAVETGLLAPGAAELNPGYVMRMQHGRPRVRIKLAMSLDGRTAGADRASQWLTGAPARRDGHRLRAESGAVLTGSGTVLADDPRLTVRLDGDWRQPLRVVLDSALRLPPTANLLAAPGRTLVFTAAEVGPAWDALAIAGAELQQLPAGLGGLDLPSVLSALAEQQVNDVLVEAGATLAGALLAADCADELLIYMAPVLVGDSGRGLLNLPGIVTFDARRRLEITAIRAVGDDWRITARPVR